MNYWDHRKPVHRARAVDVADIARAAAALLDEGGLRALTVRAVAGRLGVAPASLYSRVESAEDLYDLALDFILGDSTIEHAVLEADVPLLMLAYFRHLTKHRWACQIIGMRAPRGPNYLRLSERIVVLLEELGVRDPLGASYILSNFVIGSATTAPMSKDERVAPVDSGIAPRYARFHEHHDINAETLFKTGLAALRAQIEVE